MPSEKDQNPKNGNVYHALLKAQKSLWGVTRSSKNSFSKYEYASAESIIALTRRPLQAAGLVVGRKSVHCERLESEILVRSEFFIHHCESGDEIQSYLETLAPCAKGMTPDKAIAASMTQSLAYWLRDLFLLPRVDQASIGNIKKNKDIERFNAVLKEKEA